MSTLAKILVGSLIFTVIELVALNLWFVAVQPPIHFSTAGQVWLALLIYLEHLVSMVFGYNVGSGRDLFSIP